MEKVQGPEKIEILFVIGSLEIGGTERQMSVLANHLKIRGWSCEVFAFQAEGLLRREIADMRVPVHVGGLKKGDLKRAPWKLIWSGWKLMRVIQKRKPSVVHAFLPLVTFMGALAGRVDRVSLVITSRRGMANHQDRYLILKLFDRMANKLSHRITVNSRAVWDDTVSRDHIKPSKLVLIYNGIDPAPFDTARSWREDVRKVLGFKPNEKVIISVANFIPYKGHPDFLKAARQVVDQIPEAKFLLVGEDRGIQRGLESQAHHLGISDSVKFMGQRYDIPKLMAASDLSVLPSHEEGFSNVILESMAAALPVVATRVGGNAEAIVDGVTGWLVPPKNPSAMAKKIVDILSDPQRAKSWGNQGRKRVKETFTIERMVEGHVKLYEGWNKYSVAEREFNSR